MKTNRVMFAGAALAAGLFVAMPAAIAQGLVIDQNGVHVVPSGEDRGPPPPHRGYGQDERYVHEDEIGPRDARRIARHVGVVHTFDVGRRGRMWIVNGEDRHGHNLRVTISARSGEVVDVYRRG